MYYSDYTKMKKHRMRVWKLSDGMPLTAIGGLDVPALFSALAIAVAAALLSSAVVIVIKALTGWLLPVLLIVAVVFAGVGVAAYLTASREKVKETPVEVLKRHVLASNEPTFYAAGVDSDQTPTHLHWQVLMWRPSSTPIRVGPLRRFTTYNPAPIGVDVRRALDQYGTADLVPWSDILRPVDNQNREDVE